MKRPLDQPNESTDGCSYDSTDQERSQRCRSIRLLLHTSDGIIPYLTPLLLQKYLPAPQNHLVVGIAVRDTCSKPTFPSPESTKPNGYGFASTSLVVDPTVQPYHKLLLPTFDLLQDSIGKSPVSSHDTHVMLWTPHGRLPLTPNTYRTMCTTTANAAPATSSSLPLVSLANSSEAMFDMATDHDTKKRKETAARRTMSWWKHHEAILQETCNHMMVLFPIVLVGNTPHQAPPSPRGLPSTASGYAIVGTDHISSRQERNERLGHVLTECDPTKPVVVLSCHTFQQLLDFVRLGVDTIGTSLPTQWSQSQLAFGCDLTMMDGLPIFTSSHTNKATKKIKALKETTIPSALELDHNGCFNVGDPIFARDARPLVPGCSCLACHFHSRAYIHHLIVAKELLAQILLFCHNLTHLLEFCKQATRAKQENQLEEFCDFVEKQLNSIL